MTQQAYFADDFGYHPNYIGAFTRGQAPGAIPNGTRIKKVKSEPGDGHPVGSEGHVLGSIFHPENGYAYFVEWDARPRVAVACVAFKIAPIVTQ